LQSMWSTFLKLFSTHYFNIPKQDPTVEFQKRKLKSIYAIYTRSRNFGMFFFKT
jgi:hypothetical protein